ncbi:hypothetical protein [Cystobacter ferrugineus]|uniref:Uncharacterized protein n=1 Tax=Cystobacter ferrugineus TaxID=83449 RepID=A0A1L9B5N5_9BACT|nr:hypothetical protein [Cystobacter ferrugineus]OJH37562.1 hypothetical protein BON30_25500 [Cystobacter ferrugineus]
MAINPETQNPTEANIRFEEWKSTENKQHLVSRKRLTKEWEKRAKDNRLDTYWTRFPLRGKKGGEPPFQLGKVAVPSGNGMVSVPWTVWEKSDRLHDKEVEFYSVIRAEKHFIDAGYKKLSSKYSFVRFGQVIEDCGVDGFFFHPSKKHYVYCESKFTRDETLFASWKADKKKVWARLSNYGGKRQMGWDWIHERAQRAFKRPSGITEEMSDAEVDKIFEEAAEMKAAAAKKLGTRWVNVYGADHVPVCPGVYSFTSGEAGVGSSNELVVDWPFTPDKTEFIELNEEFDAWAAQRTGNGTAAPAQGSGG